LRKVANRQQTSNKDISSLAEVPVIKLIKTVSSCGQVLTKTEAVHAQPWLSIVTEDPRGQRDQQWVMDDVLLQLWDTRIEAAATELGFNGYDMQEGLARVCIAHFLYQCVKDILLYWQ